MLRVKLNDRYIKGTVAFQAEGDNATMSYMGEPKLPLNAEYVFEERKWRVIRVRRSLYNSQVVNVDMVAVD